MNTKMERLTIQLPPALKAQLDALRSQGYTASGFIRSLLEKELHRGGRRLDRPGGTRLTEKED